MISDIRLQNFRSYNDDSFEFSSGVNIIVGPNASGKTNLLEAILFINIGTSYRVKDTDLVKNNCDWARIETHSEKHTRIAVLKNEIKPIKQFTLDDKSYIRLSLQNTLPVVLFEPNHLLLLHGSPENRRNFLDDLLEQTEPIYKALRRDYRRTLQQRNSLLKHDKNKSRNQVFVWNIKISELGAKVVLLRSKLIDQLNESLEITYNQLSHTKSRIAIEYQPSVPLQQYGSQLLQKLEKHTELDFERGFTAYGPHREDFVIKMNNYPVSDVASRGETRTLLLAIKIFESLLIEKARNQKPILLLDDVFSELDGARRRSLTDFLQSYQTFITTTDADVVLQYFTEKSTIIPTNRINSEK